MIQRRFSVFSVVLLPSALRLIRQRSACIDRHFRSRNGAGQLRRAAPRPGPSIFKTLGNPRVAFSVRLTHKVMAIGIVGLTGLSHSVQSIRPEARRRTPRATVAKSARNIRPQQAALDRHAPGAWRNKRIFSSAAMRATRNRIPSWWSRSTVILAGSRI